jgi:hypothetical protein
MENVQPDFDGILFWSCAIADYSMRIFLISYTRQYQRDGYSNSWGEVRCGEDAAHDILRMRMTPLKTLSPGTSVYVFNK